MKISIALFCLLSISAVSFASGPYTPPPAPHADKAKKKDDKKKGDKNNKQDKDSKKGGQNS